MWFHIPAHWMNLDECQWISQANKGKARFSYNIARAPGTVGGSVKEAQIVPAETRRKKENKSMAFVRSRIDEIIIRDTIFGLRQWLQYPMTLHHNVSLY